VVKTATTAVSKSACTVLLCFVAATLCLFAWLRIYDDARIIQVTILEQGYLIFHDIKYQKNLKNMPK
jgi:hypothetical protein